MQPDKLSTPQRHILCTLLTLKTDASDGFFRCEGGILRREVNEKLRRPLAPVHFYTDITKLVEIGMLISSKEDDRTAAKERRSPRSYYALTEAGELLAKAILEEQAA